MDFATIAGEAKVQILPATTRSSQTDQRHVHAVEFGGVIGDGPQVEPLEAQVLEGVRAAGTRHAVIGEDLGTSGGLRYEVDLAGIMPR